MASDRIRATIGEMSLPDLDDVRRLCNQELVLDRYAGLIPGLLMRRPHIGLVATHGTTTLGACIGSVDQDDNGNAEGFIDVLVVGRADQRRGIGRQLAGAMEKQLAARGCQRINLSGHGPYYAWPGIDIHYTAAVCFAEDLGYQRQGCEVNMDIDLLQAPLDTESAVARLHADGVEVRRAGAGDDGRCRNPSVPSGGRAG